MDEITQKLNDEGRQLWDHKADFWDALHGEHGNIFHRQLVGPVVERLLKLKKGENVMDIACGSGIMARRFAELGARVTALDFSAALIERAQERGQVNGSPIDYAIVDATDEEALVSFGERQYEAIVCTMAFMDIPEISPLFRAARRLLKEEGRFVFATAHPAFNSNNPVFIQEMQDSHGKLEISHSLRLKAYMEKPPCKGVGAPNEPLPHTYYHRPLHELFGEAFAAKFVLDALEEPAFKPCDAKQDYGLSWSNLWQFPPVLAGRFRPLP